MVSTSILFQILTKIAAEAFQEIRRGCVIKILIPVSFLSFAAHQEESDGEESEAVSATGRARVWKGRGSEVSFQIN